MSFETAPGENGREPRTGLGASPAGRALDAGEARNSWPWRPGPLDRPSRGGLAPWQARRVIAYMTERLDQDVSLQDLAQVVRLSRFHFCSAFRVATGRTPHEMLTRLRIDHACRLLTSSKQSISEIALSVGFQTPSAFAARFRKAVGLSPRDFRRSRGFFTDPWPVPLGCSDRPTDFRLSGPTLSSEMEAQHGCSSHRNR
jgi:AraC-like DNA-binding protein